MKSKRKRCIAFRQSQHYPELMMPCTNNVPPSNGHDNRFCREHANAYREILLGIVSENQLQRARETESAA